MKLLPDFYHIGGAPLTDANDATSYLLPCGDALYLIDCGTPEGYESLLSRIRSLGYDPARIARIYGTHGHYDHIGAAALFARDFGTRLCLHAQDREQVETGDDIKTTASLLYGKSFPKAKVSHTFSDGDTFKTDAGTVEILHTPGHSMGSCCFVLRHVSGLAILIASDTLHGGFSDKIGSDEAIWRQSLDRLCALHFDAYTMGHSSPVLLHDADTRLDCLRRSFANYYNPWFKNFYETYSY